MKKLTWILERFWWVGSVPVWQIGTVLRLTGELLVALSELSSRWPRRGGQG